ncbi:MAG: TonB-dependent receptor, partial [Methylococcales bacterium]|nr:TonB-dependent receptor [Methylococcales bacterium]
MFEATVRHDGSSRFPEDQKYGTFPSMAAGWRVTEENFFKDVVPWVSNLKLKASWGVLGNQ